MYEDTPMEKIGDLFENLIFSGSSLEMDIAGKVNTVKGILKHNFEDYRNIHYGAENMLITVSGGIKEPEIIKLTEKYFGSLKKETEGKYSNYKDDQKAPKVLLKTKPIEQAHFILGFKAYPRGHKNRYIVSVLSTILGGGMSSRLFTEVREKRGLAYAVRTSPETYMDCGYLATYEGVDPKRVDEAVKVTLDEHHKLTNKLGNITDEELTRNKEFIKGHIALSLEDTRAVNSFFGLKELMLGKIESPEDIYKAIDAVTAGEIVKVAGELFVPEKLNFAVIGTYKDPERFKKLFG